MGSDGHAQLFCSAALAWGGALREAVHSPHNHAIFDATASRARRLFAAIVGGAGRMDLGLFRKALEAERFQIQAAGRDGEALLTALFNAVAEGTGDVDAQGFHAALQRLKLQVLLLPGTDKHHSDQVHGRRWDWSPGVFLESAVMSSNMCQHLLTPRAAQCTVHWTHYDDPDAVTLLRLGVRYQLHLQALDVYRSEHRESRVWRHGEDYNLLVTVARLTRASRAMLREFREEKQRTSREFGAELAAPQTRVVVEVEQAQLYLFMSGDCDTVFTTLSAWQSSAVTHHVAGGRSRCQQRRAEDQARLASRRHPCVGALESDPEPPGLFDGLIRVLQVDYTELRMGNATWLACGMLYVVVENYVKVTDAHRARLKWFEANLDGYADVELMRTKRELEHVARRLQPLAQLVARLARYDCFESDVKSYLEGVGDDITQLVNRTAHTIEVCGVLRDEVRVRQNARDDASKFHVSVMVTLLFPLQFLTGVYGMNFQDAAGQGVVPLLGSLTLERSYFMFWGLGVALTLLLAGWFKMARLL